MTETIRDRCGKTPQIGDTVVIWETVRNYVFISKVLKDGDRKTIKDPLNTSKDSPFSDLSLEVSIDLDCYRIIHVSRACPSTKRSRVTEQGGVVAKQNPTSGSKGGVMRKVAINAGRVLASGAIAVIALIASEAVYENTGSTPLSIVTLLIGVAAVATLNGINASTAVEQTSAQTRTGESLQEEKPPTFKDRK